MRVLTIAPFPPLRDGIAAYASGLADAYRSHGHRVGVVPTGPAPSAEVVAVLPKTPLGAPAALRAIAAWRPDIVHVQHAIATYGPRLPALLALLAGLRRRRIPIVITHHEVTRDTDRLKVAGRLYYRAATALADRIHVHTDTAARRLDDCGARNRPVTVQPHPIFTSERVADHGLSPADLRERLDGEQRLLVMMIGYLQNQKGHDRAVAGLAELLDRRPDLRDRLLLVIAGEVRRRPLGFAAFEQADREYEAEVRAQVAAAGLDEQVRWHGHVPDQELTTWFAAADAVLLPYLVAEDSGIAARAVAIGAPVLAAPVGGLASLFGGTALQLNSTTAADIANALEQFADEPHRLRSAARHRYQELLRERGADRLVKAITDPARAGVGSTGRTKTA